ncbi:MAG TPA: AMIN domain-containing protein [bacterium]
MKVTGINLKEVASQLQVAIVASGPVRYQVRDVQPNWIVVDVPGAQLGIPAGEVRVARGLVTKVRVGQFEPNIVRVVLELVQPIRFHLTTSPDRGAILLGIPTIVGGQPIPPRAEPTQLPLPPATPPATAPEPGPAVGFDQKISLELRNVDITDVLSALAKLAHVNLVTDAGVQGRITVRLTDVTFAEAMHLILDPNGLGFQLIGSNMIVARKEKLTGIRQHRVTNMLASAFVATYLTPLTGVGKEKAVVDDATNSFFLLGSDDDQSKVATLLARVDLPVERAITRRIKLNYLDAAAFVDLLTTRLPDAAKAAKVDKVNNAVVLVGSAGQMQILDSFLEQVDTPLAQVLIESMVVEVPTEVTHNLGVAWGTAEAMTLTWNESTPGTCCSVFSAPSIANILITTPALVFTINNLITENRSKLLANPRLAVRDGETARMNIGNKIPFQVVNAQGVPSVIIIEAGVQLEVTPHIGSDGYVTMKMHPEVSSILTAPSPGVPPTIATREADSSVTVKDGTPIVLAGLIQKNEVETTIKVPLLGDVPILGWLFRSTSTDKIDNEVIFVITPHILAKAGAG